MNTMQFEFDSVVNHLYSQGKAAEVSGSCKYRTPEGLSCAVGCRIPDDVYSPEIEGKVPGTKMDAIINTPVEIIEYVSMFRSLQLAHDGWYLSANANDGKYEFGQIVPELERVAGEFSLVFTYPEKAE